MLVTSVRLSLLKLIETYSILALTSNTSRPFLLFDRCMMIQHVCFVFDKKASRQLRNYEKKVVKDSEVMRTCLRDFWTTESLN